MKPALLLRIAAVITLVFGTLHQMGMPWAPTKVPEAVALAESMKALHFDALGANRSYWDFYQGFGISITIYLFAQGLALWFIGGVAKTRPTEVRWIVGVFLVAYAALGWVTWKYFFLPPVVLSVLVAACLAGVLVTTRRR